MGSNYTVGSIHSITLLFMNDNTVSELGLAFAQGIMAQRHVVFIILALHVSMLTFANYLLR